MYKISFYKMSKVPGELLPELRKLTLGRDVFVQWRWTYQTGECYCVILQYQECPKSASRVVSWACCTFEDDWLPIFGCYTAEDSRGLGLGRMVATELLDMLQLREHSAVFAVGEQWALWPQILEEAGLVHFEWD